MSIRLIDRVRLRRFFAHEVVAVAEQLRQRGVTFFPLGPIPDEETWYVEGSNNSAQVVDLGPNWASDLRQLWAGQDLPELVEFVDALSALVDRLPTSAPDPSDVSTFVYVMY